MDWFRFILILSFIDHSNHLLDAQLWVKFLFLRRAPGRNIRGMNRYGRLIGYLEGGIA